VDIQAKFVEKSRVDISASDSDIKTYLKSEISTNNRLSLFAAKDIKLKEDIVKSVSEKAAGM
jgi:ankyrin repeat domain-containing protein 50